MRKLLLATVAICSIASSANANISQGCWLLYLNALNLTNEFSNSPATTVQIRTVATGPDVGTWRYTTRPEVTGTYHAGIRGLTFAIKLDGFIHAYQLDWVGPKFAFGKYVTVGALANPVTLGSRGAARLTRPANDICTLP